MRTAACLTLTRTNREAGHSGANDLAAILALLGAGADPNVKNNAGQTAIDVVKTATANREAIIAILRRETGR